MHHFVFDVTRYQVPGIRYTLKPWDLLIRMHFRFLSKPVFVEVYRRSREKPTAKMGLHLYL